MKTTLILSLLFSLFTADAYALPRLKPQPLLGELQDAQPSVPRQDSPRA